MYVEMRKARRLIAVGLPSTGVAGLETRRHLPNNLAKKPFFSFLRRRDLSNRS